MSGTSGSASDANHVPVRPMPVTTSSSTIRKPCRSRRSARPCQNASGGEWAGSAAAEIGSQRNAAMESAPCVPMCASSASSAPWPLGSKRHVDGGTYRPGVTNGWYGAHSPGRPVRRERGHRRAVVGLRLRDDAGAARLAALHVVVVGEPQRRLVGLGTAGHEVHAVEAGRRDADELGRQPLLRRRGELLVVEVRELVGLTRRGVDDLAHAGAERRRHRAAADRVEVAVAGRVLQPHALAAHDQRVAAVELAHEDVRRLVVDERALRHHDLPARLNALEAEPLHAAACAVKPGYAARRPRRSTSVGVSVPRKPVTTPSSPWIAVTRPTTGTTLPSGRT